MKKFRQNLAKKYGPTPDTPTIEEDDDEMFLSELSMALGEDNNMDESRGSDDQSNAKSTTTTTSSTSRMAKLMQSLKLTSERHKNDVERVSFSMFILSLQTALAEKCYQTANSSRRQSVLVGSQRRLSRHTLVPATGGTGKQYEEYLT